MDKNKVKIELYKSKEMAKFSHYASGTLYYTVQLEEGKFQFPIETVDEEYGYKAPVNDDGQFTEPTERYVIGVSLSSDLGTTSFGAQMRGSELNRWINMAIDGGLFLRVG